ncbi:putative cation/H+ exchanger, CPA1 family [Helianthus debilis subsp. tardiflorus]
MDQLIPNTTTSSLAINLNTDHRQVVPITLFVAVLCLCLVIGHVLNENRWVNESITAIIIVHFFLPSCIYIRWVSVPYHIVHISKLRAFTYLTFYIFIL